MLKDDILAYRIREMQKKREYMRRRRELLDMAEEDRLAMMMRDGCVMFKFFGMMPTRTSGMDPRKMRGWRFAGGSGVDNGDEEWEPERQRKIAAEKLKRQQYSLLMEKMLKQRMEDRERLEDPDGLTKAEREAMNNNFMALEEQLTR